MGTLLNRSSLRDAARTRLAHLRRTLDRAELAAAGERVAEALERLLAARAAHVPRTGPAGAPPAMAGYAAVRGELPVDIALMRARASGWITALPVTAGTAMRFVPFDETVPMRAGRFGIEEPDLDADALESACLAPAELAVVLVPLLGFDARLNRLGMGGGFYDRAFAAGTRAPDRERPLLIGIAHGFQQLEDAWPMSWDVPLDAVVTERGTIGTLPG